METINPGYGDVIDVLESHSLRQLTLFFRNRL